VRTAKIISLGGRHSRRPLFIGVFIFRYRGHPKSILLSIKNLHDCCLTIELLKIIIMEGIDAIPYKNR
jgi:hypothetical protein